MRTGVQRFSMACAATFAALLGSDAGAVRIDGIGLTPVAATATPAVREGRLEVRLSEQQVIAVSPWPATLPQRFDRQQVSAARQLHPAGPVDTVSFTRNGEKAPWLQIVRGARTASTVVGNWQLQRSARGWSVSNGSTAHWLGNATPGASHAQPPRPASIAAGADRWCLYLLASRPQETAESGLAAETESQADWAAVRLPRGSKQCR